jgi:hypothetical protein
MMTMIINIPERVLLTKVSKMSDLRGDTCGYTLVFYDITEAVSRDEPGAPGADKAAVDEDTHRVGQSHRAGRCGLGPLCARGRPLHLGSRGAGSSFCNLTISDLESRLDTGSFLRIHRSYLANLDYAEQIVRDDGKVTLKLNGGDDQGLPVARANVPRLLERLGITEPVGER